jgi:hypothetical protein
MTPITRRDFAILQDQMLTAFNNLAIKLQQAPPSTTPANRISPSPTGYSDDGDGDDEGESEVEFDIRPQRKAKKLVRHRPAAYNAFQVSQLLLRVIHGSSPNHM